MESAARRLEDRAPVHVTVDLSGSDIHTVAQQGITVDVACTDDNGKERLDVPLNTPVQQDGATYRYFPRQTFFYTCSWPLSTWLWKHAADYDVIHIHALFSYSSTAAAFSS